MIVALPVQILREFLDMVVKIMQNECISFDADKYSTPLLKQLRDKGRKRSSSDAFRETADALDHLELAPRVKRVRRPPPMLTIYVRKETEKAYNAIFMEEKSVQNFKEAVSMRYGLTVDSVKSVALRSKSGADAVSVQQEVLDDCKTPLFHGSVVELDEQSIKAFLDEDDFLISLDYDSTDGTCKVTLSVSPSR